MKAGTLFAVVFFAALSAFAQQNHTVQSPITMEQLMRELRIEGGNWVFKFDRAVFAKVVCTVSTYPDGKTSEVTEFVSDSPEREFSLFFMASADQVGEYPAPGKTNGKKMKVKLSSCEATNGTRIVAYVDKFAHNPWLQQKGERGEYSPCMPLKPELNKEYVLHYYYKEGDPYEAKATICFMEKLEDASKVQRFDRGKPRTWKSADEAQ